LVTNLFTSIVDNVFGFKALRALRLENLCLFSASDLKPNPEGSLLDTWAYFFLLILFGISVSKLFYFLNSQFCFSSFNNYLYKKNNIPFASISRSQSKPTLRLRSKTVLKRAESCPAMVSLDRTPLDNDIKSSLVIPTLTEKKLIVLTESNKGIKRFS
jgi:hypothetical protein